MHIYTYIMHVCIRTYTYMYIIYVCIFTYTYMYIYLHIQIYTYNFSGLYKMFFIPKYRSYSCRENKTETESKVHVGFCPLAMSRSLTDYSHFSKIRLHGNGHFLLVE